MHTSLIRLFLLRQYNILFLKSVVLSFVLKGLGGMKEGTYREIIIIKPNHLVVYRKYGLKSTRTMPERTNIQRGIKPSVFRKISEKVAIWLNAAMLRGRLLTMITLTLTDEQKTGDVDVKRNMLNKYLINLKRQGVCNYFWKAERQRNGNIHFHIITDQYIDKDRIRLMWLRTLKKGGYKADMNRLTRYPCTHVEVINNRTVGYLSKYLGKGDMIEGRIWYMTRELSRLQYMSISLIESSYILEPNEKYRVIQGHSLLKAEKVKFRWDFFYHDAAQELYKRQEK